MPDTIIEFMGLNKEQEGVLNLDEDVIVEACAGSGKTRSLVARYLAILAEGRADVEGIVAITFTENGAAELKDRIRGEISRFVDTHGERGFLSQEAISKLSYAPITTIHGFCARLLGDHPLEAGIGPRFAVKEGVELSAFEDEALYEYMIKALGSEDEKTSRLAEELLAEERYDYASLKGLISSVLSHAKRLHLAPPFEVFSHSHCGEELGVIAGRLVSHACIDSLPGFRERLKTYISFIEASRSPSSLARGAAGVVTVLKELVAKEKSPAVMEKAGELLSIASQALAHCEVRFTRRLLAFAEGAHDFLNAKKRELGIVDYEDLLMLARDLLSRNGHILESLRRRFKYIMVDEFQDTDSLQFEIVSMLAGAGGANLFIVGDPKQSIYRFRGGDPGVFRSLRSSARGVSFRCNFRSQKPLVDYCNSFFSRYFGEEYEEMKSHATPKSTPCGVEFIVSVGEGADDWRREEARKIALRIKELKGEGYEWGQMGILLRSSTSVFFIENALREHGIPFSSMGGEFYERDEVRDVASFLRCLLYPEDKIAEACVLRSPIFGASDEELLAFYALGEEPEGFMEFLNQIEELRREVPHLTPLEILGRFIFDMGYGAASAALPEAEERRANLRKLMTVVSELEGDGWGIGEILDYLDGAMSEGVEGVPGGELNEGAGVKILTVHRAKGLEFDVVFLADLNHGAGRNNARVLARRDAGFIARYDFAKSHLWRELEELEEKDELEEEKRVLYVAKTRAKERLIICLGGRKKKDGGLRLSKGSFADFVASTLGLPPDFEKEGTLRAFGMEFPIWKMKEGVAMGELAPCGEKPTLPRSLNELERRFIDIAGSEKSPPSIDGSMRLICAPPDDVEMGSIIHHFLEIWDFREETIERDASFVLSYRFLEIGGVVNEIRAIAERFLSSPLMYKIKTARRVYREVPYTILIDGKPDRGRIDLLIEGEEGFELFDYKYTDDWDRLDYGEQLDRYGKALFAFFGAYPTRSYLVLLPQVRLVDPPHL
jgi:ATP-dependent helicase/nuclease subunit A